MTFDEWVGQPQFQDWNWQDHRVAELAWRAAADVSAAAEVERLRDELQRAQEALQRACGWLHAAYDRPPQTLECVSMLHDVDTARGLGQ
jgi:hypothetical protein